MTARPVVGVLCCNEVASRAVQVVASRFVEPLSMLADATVLLVPAMAEASDIAHLSLLLDGLLLTGSRSHVAPHRYRGSASLPDRALDEDRDEVALRLGERMIGLGKPVFGICRIAGDQRAVRRHAVQPRRRPAAPFGRLGPAL